MKRRSVIIIAVFCAAVILASIAGFVGLIRTRPRAAHHKPASPAILVTTMTPERVDEPVRIEGMGEIIPARRVVIQPEITGRIVTVHPGLIAGGICRAGEILVTIDDRDYREALRQAEARLVTARSALEIEEGACRIAEKEWRMMGEPSADPSADPPASDLALRKPQLARAKADVASAESAVALARLNLQRTTIRAPFDGIILDEDAETGRHVSPQSNLLTLAGTARFHARISLTTDSIPWLRLPDAHGAGGSPATIRAAGVAGPSPVKTGRLIRLLGDLDTAGRMARVLLEIDDPLGIAGDDVMDPAPLLLGSYVHVVIQGRRSGPAISLPNDLIHEGDTVFIMDDTDSLVIRPVEILHRYRDYSLVKSGLTGDERVISSRIPNPVPGLKLRVLSTASTPSEPVPATGKGRE